MSNYNSPMNLAAKASAGLPRRSVCAEAGYAMAALLVGMAVMAVMLSAAMPTWSQMIRREKEEELIFRGSQYARAFALYQAKFANASPANLDVLVEQRMLRKKFRDPMSPNKDGEFALLYMSNQPPGASGGGFGAGSPGGAGGTGGMGGTGGTGTSAGGSGAGRGTSFTPATGADATTTGSAAYTTTRSGPIMGVASKNTGASIKVYKGKKRYNEWYFVGREGGAGGAGGAGGGAGGIGPGGAGGRGGRGGRGGDGGFPGGGRGPTGGSFPGGGRGGSGSGGFGGRGGAGGGFPGSGGPMPSPPR